MSLLLDALKKSEAQRRRGQAPSIDPARRPGSGAASAGERPRRWPWLAGAALLVLLAVAALPWLPALRDAPDGRSEPAAAPAAGERVAASSPPALQTEPAPSRPAVNVPTAPPEAVRAVAAQRSQIETPAAPAQAAPDPAAQPEPQAAAPPRTDPRPAGSRIEPPRTEQPRAGDRQAIQPEPAEPQPAEPQPAEQRAERPEPDPDSAAALDAIHPWDLPQAQRAAFPALDLTVHFFAADPADRFVIVNGERYGEGDAIEGGVRVERIVREGAVVDFRNYRILIE
jgi:general secretion pathway protein B